MQEFVNIFCSFTERKTRNNKIKGLLLLIVFAFFKYISNTQSRRIQIRFKI